jgi:hypothetical protein
MKNFMHATPQGFQVDPAEAEGLPGLAITVDLLKALGSEEVNGGWEFKMHGYVFRFEQDGPGHWRYIGPGTVSWHCATHLDECFGFLAEDMYESGRRQKLVEVRDALGIGGEPSFGQSGAH